MIVGLLCKEMYEIMICFVFFFIIMEDEINWVVERIK